MAEWSPDDNAFPSSCDVCLRDLRLRVPRIVLAARSDPGGGEFETSDLFDGRLVPLWFSRGDDRETRSDVVCPTRSFSPAP